MATPKTVWGIDIGQVALKAVKLQYVEGELQVEAFDIIEHSKILSEPDADKRHLIRNALEQFLARNNVSDSLVAVAVPGQSSFTRFVKLPPVDAKKIPDIVRYEAEQQIPFPIDEVIWRWQNFVDPDSPDMEVGIFAMKQIDVHEMIDRFTEVGMDVGMVQMAPLALYNFLLYDGQLAPEGATLLADVGADKTDLVVADGPRMWIRTIQIGGNNFTEALVKAFKLSFPKAEKLKRTATTSKYAKQVFQAMRPVFADLVQEIQRSIGFYTALHRDTRFKRIVGLGNGFRLPGLQKFLEQNLNVAVVPVDSYNKLTPSPTVSAPHFAENVLSLAVAYGLALQGLGISPVQTNLLPREIATHRTWAKKRWWFTAAAAALLLALAMPWFNNHRIAKTLAEETGRAELAKVEQKVRVQQGFQNQSAGLKGQIEDCHKEIAKYTDLFKYRMFWPALQSMIWQSLSDSRVAKNQSMLQDYVTAGDDKTRKQKLQAIQDIPRAKREVFMIDRMTVQCLQNASTVSAGDPVSSSGLPGTGGMPGGGTGAPPPFNGGPQPQGTPAAGGKPGFMITVVGRTPLPVDRASEKIFGNVDPLSRELAAQSKMFEIRPSRSGFYVQRIDTVQSTGTTGGGNVIAPRPGGYGEGPVPGASTAPAGPKNPDPMLPDEDMSSDTEFTIVWVVVVTDDASGGDKPGGQN